MGEWDDMLGRGEYQPPTIEDLRAEVARLKYALDEARRANEALLRERNTWARQQADLRDDRDAAREEAEVARTARAGAENERDVLTLRVENAEARLARVRAALLRGGQTPAIRARDAIAVLEEAVDA